MSKLTENGDGSRLFGCRPSDLLNPILGVKVASSRRMSQMQAVWRLTNSILHTVYADRSRKSTVCPYFPGFSLPNPAHLDAIRPATTGSMKRGNRVGPVRGHWN